MMTQSCKISVWQKIKGHPLKLLVPYEKDTTIDLRPNN